MVFGKHFLEATPVLTCCFNAFLAAIGQKRNFVLSSHRTVKHAFFFLLSLSCTVIWKPDQDYEISAHKLWSFFLLLRWELTSQWWLGAVGTSCSHRTRLYVSGSAELGVLLGWHTGWWNVRFLIVIKFTKEEIMADVSFCQSRTASLKCDMMYYERVSINTIPVNKSRDWRT